MKSRMLLISLAVMLALSVGLTGCGGEETPEITKYTLTISSTDGGDNACVPAVGCTCAEGTKDSGGVTVPAQCVCAEGTEVGILASPAFGYRFIGWTGDVDAIGDVDAAETTIIMIGDYSITANFEELPECDLAISSTAGGNVSTPGEGTFTCHEGTVVSLAATPTAGHQFVNWTGDVNSIGNVNAASTTIAMNDDYSIKANFAEISEYVLIIASTAGGLVTAPGLGIFHREEGTVVNLVATADGGFYFVRWTGDTDTIDNVNAATTTITMNDDYSIKADFAVTFPDANLEVAIREALGKPTEDIYQSNLDTLTIFDAENRNITDLTGLEHCRNLTRIDLDCNQISNVSPLANLTGLTVLCIRHNQITDILPLADLTNLTFLSVIGNQISDISPLVNLTSLATLHLVNNQISDISPLAGLTNLTSLHLQTNQIGNISPLSNLTKLKSLYLNGNQISDISPLVLNSGLATGDIIGLMNNPLSSDSINIYIPQLQARGVTVAY